ncbi:hypothetical protein VT52_018645 [Streptomyces malaysiense]|uniref:Uncharacterized protein n=1 Tax=Streptomyces malaysiense TaxID=1428626 RepID=A0A1J4PZA7_9ACTN|nr:hypothetical protein VT52_018645 [Streptomyces malaysiense]
MVVLELFPASSRARTAAVSLNRPCMPVTTTSWKSASFSRYDATAPCTASASRLDRRLHATARPRSRRVTPERYLM